MTAQLEPWLSRNVAEWHDALEPDTLPTCSDNSPKNETPPLQPPPTLYISIRYTTREWSKIQRWLPASFPRLPTGMMISIFNLRHPGLAPFDEGAVGKEVCGDGHKPVLPKRTPVTFHVQKEFCHSCHRFLV